MSIKFYLQDNALTPDPNDYIAVVQINGAKTLQDILDEAARRGTLVTRTDMIAVSNLLFEIITDFVAAGFSVITPAVNIKPSIKGVFLGAGAGFNSKDHYVKASLSAGMLLKSKMESASVTKIEAGENKPLLMDFVDNESNASNTTVTPGGVATIAGARLKYDAANVNEGIFFIDSNFAETRVASIADNKPSRLIFSVPKTLLPGTYLVEVRNSNHNPANLKTGRLPDPLTVL